jgi:hypothetical protein
MSSNIWLLGGVVAAAFCAGSFAGMLLAALMYMAHDEPKPGWSE